MYIYMYLLIDIAFNLWNTASHYLLFSFKTIQFPFQCSLHSFSVSEKYLGKIQTHSSLWSLFVSLGSVPRCTFVPVWKTGVRFSDVPFFSLTFTHT